MHITDTEVLVVGGGPVGLTMACELMRHGVKVRLVDERPARSVHSKALGITPRTLELLHIMGLAETFVGAGNRLHRITAHAQGRILTRIEFDSLRSPYPFVLCLPQSETERLLEEQLARLGGVIERGLAFRGLEASDQSLRARLRHADGTEEAATAAWLVGCDGAHSAVRHAAGVSFRGAAYDDSFVLADVRVEGEVAMDEVNFYLAQDGAAGFVPFGGGRARVVATEPRGTPNGQEAPPTLSEFQRLVERRTGSRARLCELEWASRFRVSRRKVDRLRQGRVFLAGDAAHIHSPAGGQGMNTGMQDAFNLAWKLALVLRGRAPESLFDSYDAERGPVARTVLRMTDRATRMILSENRALQALRNRLIPFVASFQGAREKLLGGLSELAVNYARSPIVEQHGHGPLGAGDRMPDGELTETATGRQVRIFDLLREARHLLLFFHQGDMDDARAAAFTAAARETVGEIVSVRLVLPRENRGVQSLPAVLRDERGDVWARFAGPAGGIVLVRPDGYVGFYGEGAPMERLWRFFSRHFILTVSLQQSAEKSTAPAGSIPQPD